MRRLPSRLVRLLFCLSQVENHAKGRPVAVRTGPEYFGPKIGPKVLGLEHADRGLLPEIQIQSAPRRHGKRVVLFVRSDGGHGPVGVGQTNQDVAKWDEPVYSLEKSRPVQDRMYSLAIGRTKEVSRLVVTAEIECASKPAVYILGQSEVPSAEPGRPVAKRVETRRRLEELAHAGALQRITTEYLPFGVLLRQAGHCKKQDEQEKLQKVSNQPALPRRKVSGRAVNPTRGDVPEIEARRRCFEIVRVPGRRLQRRFVRKRKYPAPRYSFWSDRLLQQCGLPCACRR